MRIDISNLGKEKKFRIIPSNINEASYVQNLFPEVTPNKDGSVNVYMSRRNLKIILEEEKVIPSINATVDIERIKKIEDKHNNLRPFLIRLKEAAISPVKKGECVSLTHAITTIFDPFSHQIAMLNHMYHSLNSIHKYTSHALFLEQGTGKTAISVAWAEFLIENGYIDQVLVVAPLMTLENSWQSDIKKFSYLDSEIFWTNKAGKYGNAHREEVLSKKPQFVLVNPDGLRVHKDMLAEQKFNMMIIDESSCIKNPESKVFKAACTVGALARFKLILNGTPMPNSPLDLWSQFYWLDDGVTLDASFFDFRSTYMMRINEFWKPIRGFSAKLSKKIEPFSVNFRKEEVLDLPERVSVLKRVSLGSKQRMLYDNLERDSFLEYENKTVELRTLLPKFNKLRQVTSGFFIPTEEEDPVDISGSTKIECLSEIAEEICMDNENQGIIWISFRHEVKIIEDRLKKMKIDFVTIYGGTRRQIGLENMRQFQYNKKIKFMIGHPASIGVGTNLQNSNYSIYYSVSENLQHYLQSIDRNHRSGQNKKVTVYHIVGKDTYDERLMKLLRRKEDVQSFTISRFNLKDLRAPDIEETWNIRDA